jgi:hypothetical protein
MAEVTTPIPTLSQPQFSTQQVCANCRFWQNQMCHRYPPTVYDKVGDGGRTLFPLTGAGDWCGEYQPQIHVQSQFVVKQTYNLP